MKHQSHKDIILRLKRARGHLDKVINMLEQEEPCTPVAQQLHAVVRALGSAKQILIQDHIDHCITDGSTGTSPDATAELLADLKEITKYLS